MLKIPVSTFRSVQDRNVMLKTIKLFTTTDLGLLRIIPIISVSIARNALDAKEGYTVRFTISIVERLRKSLIVLKLETNCTFVKDASLREIKVLPPTDMIMKFSNKWSPLVLRMDIQFTNVSVVVI